MTLKLIIVSMLQLPMLWFHPWFHYDRRFYNDCRNFKIAPLFRFIVSFVLVFIPFSLNIKIWTSYDFNLLIHLSDIRDQGHTNIL